MSKLCVVFNICGISGREAVNQYVNGIKSILAQNFKDFRLAISSCLNSELVKTRLISEFGSSVSYNFIDEVLPVNVTFNHTCQKMQAEFGDFEGYLYLDSGLSCQTADDIETLYNLFKSRQAGMVAAQTNTDGGYHQWFGIGQNEYDHSQNHQFFANGDFTIPIGKTVNLHAQIFSGDILKVFGNIIPDIFAGYCTESTFGVLCGALHKPFLLSKHVIFNHHHGMDGGSSGFDPVKWRASGNKNWEHPFRCDGIVGRLLTAQKYGLFYETCQNIIPVLDGTYDENGNAIYPLELIREAKARLFLNEKEFDYSGVRHMFISQSPMG